MSWNACDLRDGLFASGAFPAEWAAFGTGVPWASVVQGPLTLGGGVPKVTLSCLEWSVSGLGTLPATIRIFGRLVAGAQVRTYSYEVPVDD